MLFVKVYTDVTTVALRYVHPRTFKTIQETADYPTDNFIALIPGKVTLEWDNIHCSISSYIGV